MSQCGCRCAPTLQVYVCCAPPLRAKLLRSPPSLPPLPTPRGARPDPRHTHHPHCLRAAGTPGVGGQRRGQRGLQATPERLLVRQATVPPQQRQRRLQYPTPNLSHPTRVLTPPLLGVRACERVLIRALLIVAYCVLAPPLLGMRARADSCQTLLASGRCPLLFCRLRTFHWALPHDRTDHASG